MSAQLTSQLLVGALVRRTNAEGGSAMVLRKGEATSGTIVLQLLERGQNMGLFERVTDLSGQKQLRPCGPRQSEQDTEILQYIDKRMRVDPDIWFVELDIADGQRLAAEILCAG